MSEECLRRRREVCGCFSEDLHTSNITDRIAPSKHEPLRKVLEVDIQYIIGYFWNFVNVISTYQRYFQSESGEVGILSFRYDPSRA